VLNQNNFKTRIYASNLMIEWKRSPIRENRFVYRNLKINISSHRLVCKSMAQFRSDPVRYNKILSSAVNLMFSEEEELSKLTYHESSLTSASTHRASSVDQDSKSLPLDLGYVEAVDEICNESSKLDSKLLELQEYLATVEKNFPSRMDERSQLSDDEILCAIEEKVNMTGSLNSVSAVIFAL